MNEPLIRDLALLPKETSLNIADLSKVVDLVAGKNADGSKRDWVEDNIISIREKVKGSKHSTIYYPASGRDLIRPLFAFDADHLIAVDNDPQLSGETEKQLKEMGISFSSSHSEDLKTSDTTFELGGKKRRITQICKDARYVRLSDLGLEQVDILHIYAPSGADEDITEEDLYLQEKYGRNWRFKNFDEATRVEMKENPYAPKVDPQTGKYKVLGPKVNKSLTQANYQLVNEGGFFIFGEMELSYYDLPRSLLDLMGLENSKITRRHPWTILTTFHPKAEEIDTHAPSLRFSGVVLLKIQASLVLNPAFAGI